MTQNFQRGFGDGGRSRFDTKTLISVVGLLASLVILATLGVNFQAVTLSDSVETEVKSDVSEKGGADIVEVFAPKEFIRAGAKFADHRFKTVGLERAQLPDDVVVDISELQGMYATSDVFPGSTIRRSHLSPTRVLQTIQITQGMRAVTIGVDSTAGLEGWARPGSQVDVVLTYAVNGELTSKVIVQNARVLSYAGDSRTSRERGTDRSRKSSVGRNTITLEVAPADGLKIQTSRQMGNLSLMMRAEEDNKSTGVIEVDRDEIHGTKVGPTAKQKCTRGTIKIGGKDYNMDCEGDIVRER